MKPKMKLKIIALVGFARSGKDTIAKFLPEYQRVAFADALKREVMQQIKDESGLDVDLFDEEQKIKHRARLVEWGEKRRAENPDYWIDRALEGLKHSGRYVFTDCRYLNEVKRLKALGAKIAFVYRPGFGPANSIEKASIEEICNSDLVDVTIWNNSSVDNLRINAISLIFDSFDDL